MEHYYTNNPNSTSNEKKISAHILGKEYFFITDNGVFSKDSVDFGTKTLLESFNTTKEQAAVCDLGCGYGVVTVVLGTANPSYKYTLIDVNKRSLELAEKNVNLNKLNNEVNFLENDALDNIEEKFDIIVTNPPIRAGKKVVHKMMEQSYNNLNSSGELWVVIQKKQGMASCKKLLEQLFNKVEIVSKNKGYYILKSVK